MSNDYDLNKDKTVSEKELEKARKIIELENQDQREDAQRHMAWVALVGIVGYPIIVFIMFIFGITDAVTVLTGISPTYFASLAAVIMAFYGKEAYIGRGKVPRHQKQNDDLDDMIVK